MTTKYESGVNVPELFTAILKGPEEFHKVLGEFDTNINPTDEYQNTAILVAAGQGSVETITYLLDHGATIHAKNVFGSTVLHFASAKGHEATVKLFLDRGADVKATDKSGNTVMHSAAEGGNVKIASLFLELGIGVEQKNSSELAALHFAVRAKNLEMVDFLIQSGADINARSYHNMTPLHHAIEKDSEEIVRLLLDRGADVSSEDVYHQNALHFAAENGNVNLIALFTSLAIDINKKGFKDRTALHVAAQNGHLKAVELLLDHGLSIHAKDSDGKSVLDYACKGGLESVVQLLLNRSSLVSDDSLHFVAKTNNVELLQRILDSGVDVNTMDEQGLSALYIASELGNDKVVRVLLDRGALLTDDIVIQAAKTGNYNTLSHLIDFGADINELKENGKSLLHFASEWGNEDAVRFLLNRGALITENNCSGQTVLHSGAKGGNTNVIQLFLDRGIAVDARDQNNNTALHLAIEKKNVSAAKLLLDSGADVNARGIFKMSVLYIAFDNFSYRLRSFTLDLLRVTNTELIKVLLHNQADPQDKDVLSSVFCWNDYLTAEKLFDDGAKINSTADLNTENPYYFKQRMGKCLQVFLDNQFNVNESSHQENLIAQALRYNNHSVAKVITRHVVKMKHQNLYVSDTVWRDIMDNSELKTYQSECEEEIKVMQTELFPDSTVSYFDVLTTRNLQRLESYARNKNIVEGFKSYDKKKMFPIYAYPMYTQIRNGAWRKLLVDQAADFFVAVTSAKCTDHQLPKLPATFIHELFCYLPNKELKMLTRACKSKFQMDIHDVTKNLIFN